MPKLNWDGNDFRNSQDSSGTVADNISRSGNLQQGYNHGSLTRGLVAYYPMEKGQGTVLQDGALDNMGQIEGPVWYTGGQVGSNSLEFNAGDDEVSIGRADSVISSNKFTVTTWVYARAADSNEVICGNWNSSSGSIQLDLGSPGGSSIKPRFYIHDGNAKNAQTSNSYSQGEWVHLAFIFDGSEAAIYVNGTKDGTTSSSFSGFNNADFLLGDYTNDGSNLDGLLDDFRIFERVLSKPEIQSLANLSELSGVKRTESSLPGIDDGGVSHWKLDNENNDANLAKDSWGDNNGTINGTSYSSDSVFGNSLRFDSGSDYVDTSYNGPVDGGSFSIGSWVKSDDLSTNRHYLGPYDHSTKKGFWLESYTGSSNGNWRFGIGTDGNYTVVDASQPLNAGDWYHVYGTYDGSVMRLYVNGKLEAKASTSYVQGPGLRMGHIDPDNFSPLIGNLEDVRTYNRALRPVEIERLYHKGAYRINREGTLQ